MFIRRVSTLLIALFVAACGMGEFAVPGESDDGVRDDGTSSWEEAGGSSSGGSNSRAIASCSDGKACSEIISGDAEAFAEQCSRQGNRGAQSPCPESYKGSGAPSCRNATWTSAGVKVKGNYYWNSNYCAQTSDMINTYGTCCDLNGTPGGRHCRNVTDCRDH